MRKLSVLITYVKKYLETLILCRCFTIYFIKYFRQWLHPFFGKILHIKPIKLLIDTRIPLQYRSVNLPSIVYNFSVVYQSYGHTNRKVDLFIAASWLLGTEVGSCYFECREICLLFKTSYEAYISVLHNQRHRSILAQFRCSILPLGAETGRLMLLRPECRRSMLLFRWYTLIIWSFDCKFYTEHLNDLFSKYCNFNDLDTRNELQVPIFSRQKTQQNWY